MAKLHLFLLLAVLTFEVISATHILKRQTVDDIDSNDVSDEYSDGDNSDNSDDLSNDSDDSSPALGSKYHSWRATGRPGFTKPKKPWYVKPTKPTTKVTPPTTKPTESTSSTDDITIPTLPTTLSTAMTPSTVSTISTTISTTKLTEATTQSTLPTTLKPFRDPKKCLEDCPVTPEIYPVCGSDEKTYKNPTYLYCEAKCVKNISFAYGGPCKNDNSTEFTTTMAPTTVNPDCQRDCNRTCPVSPYFHPVCGSNGITYKNSGYLVCASFCNLELLFVSDGPCSGTIGTTTQSTPTPTPPENCIRKCPTLTTEYNPVCGSNGVTYKNPSELLCAQRCGVNASLARTGRCPKSPSTTTQSPDVNPSKDTDITDCTRKCPVGTDYGPVCGTNGETYFNLNELVCHQKCGIKVTVAYERPCEVTFPTTSTTSPIITTLATTTQSTATQDECFSKCPVSSDYHPVCGTNGVTYKNPGLLVCAFLCNIDVSFEYEGPCSSSYPGPGGSGTTMKPLPGSPNCNRKCPMSPYQFPVCGSDGVTYYNSGYLVCASFCNPKLRFVSEGNCPETTTAGTGTTSKGPLRPDTHAQCLKDCPVIDNHNEICGSDGKTYLNPSYIICEQMCGTDVKVAYKGPCQTTPSTTTTATVTIPMEPERECMKKCPVSPEYQPVCGSDGVTYMNPGHLVCSSFCNVRDLSIVSEGPCQTTPVGSTPNIGKPTEPTPPKGGQNTQDCINKCPTLTPEYNPLCGSDGVTYKNPSQLQCAQRCGANVTLVRKGRCQPVTTSPTVSPTPTSNPDINVDPQRECTKKCPVSPVYKPVCGSDGVTYNNSGVLVCASFCNNGNIKFVSEGICPETTTIGTTIGTTVKVPIENDCMKKCPMPTEYQPVCGSDGVTYKNAGHLMCATFCDLNVSYVSNGPCPESTTATSNPTDTTPTEPTDEVEKCLKKCPLTIDIRPVCGSDGKTYQNPSDVSCRKKCGINISVDHEGPCETANSTTTTSGVSVTTARITTEMPDSKRECIRKCPASPYYHPVCGSDGVTYKNSGHLVCAYCCRVDVSYVSDGPCPETTTVEISTYTPDRENNTNGIIEKCMAKCSASKEYKPVCGTDGVTYVNVGKLICANSCGIKVFIAAAGPCEAGGTTVNPITVNPVDKERRKCTENCPVTSEYNPLCGSDGVTYANSGRFNCALSCGVKVTVVAKGVCGAVTPDPSNGLEKQKQCIKKCPKTMEYMPVCGSDGITYANMAHLRCAKLCGIDVSVKTNGACLKPVNPDDNDEPDIDPRLSCAEGCLLSEEYDPVCGSNRVTYYNTASMVCDARCTPAIIMVTKKGFCVDTSTDPTPVLTTVATTFNPLREPDDFVVRQCVNRCPPPTEYNPVCGTDDKVYFSSERLQCVRKCGVDVEVKHQGRCNTIR